jgi:PAS domain S-box-containing protein
MTHSVYEALLNSNAVIEFDPKGQILWANDNFLNIFGYKLEEIVGKNHSLFMPRTFEHVEWQNTWQAVLEGKVQAGEFRRITKTKAEVWIQGSYTPVKDNSGKVTRVIKMAIDITEQHRLAENLARKNNELLSVAEKAEAATYAKSVFLANMSHEIRTPLNSIIGITDTLAETPLDKDQSNFVEILQRANHQLMTIINDVLDLSKVEAGEVELNIMPFNIRKVLDDIVSVLGFRAKEKGLRLKVELDADVDLYYVGDADRLRQILMNLLNNSIKFTGQGEIALRISKNPTQKDGNLLFCVSDTGIGISKSKFRDIFKPFTQADSATTRRFGGTGLGLAITQKIVTLMNGQIWVESEENRGSNFYFTVSMPVTSSANLALQGSLEKYLKSQDIKHGFESNRMRILVVDDVDDNRNLIGIYLQKTIHDIQYAQSGLEALKMVQAEAFDVIFMDVQMPEMDGYEATRMIRRLETEQKRMPCRIYACTANAFSEDVAKSLSAGCDQHLSKPIRKDTLLKAINSTVHF